MGLNGDNRLNREWDNSLQGEWIQSQMPRIGLNRDNRDNRKDCLEGVIANALVMRGSLQGIITLTQLGSQSQNAQS